MKPPILAAHLHMLPRLQAEEALLAAQVAALPYAQRRQQQRLLRQWSDAAAGERRRVAGDPRQVIAGLAAAGLKVVREKPSE